MKNIKVLSLLLLLASKQMLSSTNVDLAFVCVYQAIDGLSKTIFSDNEDIAATQLIKSINECIEFDIKQQKTIADSKASWMNAYQGIPFDNKKIQIEIDESLKRLNELDGNIRDLKKHNQKNSKRIDNRREERRNKKAELDKEQAALAAYTSQQAAEAKIKKLQEKNAVALDDAIESYIIRFGQCYKKGDTIVVSSVHGQDIAITPKEFTSLVATLNKAYAQFKNTQITLDLNDGSEVIVSIDQLVKYINNMPVASASYASWAAFGLKATAGIAAAITASAIAYNLYEGKDWNDTSNAQDLYNSAAANASSAAASAYDALGYGQTNDQSSADQTFDFSSWFPQS